ncbi:ectoine hydroxylase-related dioxygenase (phytanoyl-CoA dioxygenase family) [Kutzneria viridogrisea]|uniref:Ectoine hydroxylase-related dioxygenase (Phytanoyl-CoA dioxygenase family) n=1 Tax=Kutzneria viridogrisea TaxID=47990 RepID=A0ABR6BUS4_9PSEU|nr:ectoine hydroxylase-related dioxygenase (phytanoyl-CoA dioxygenase family) [Kutzneria viridogrisea]
MRTSFRQDGYLVVPNVLSAAQIAKARRALAEMERSETHTLQKGDVEALREGRGGYYIWHQSFIRQESRSLLDLYTETGIGKLADQLLRSDIPSTQPRVAQVVVTVPPWPGHGPQRVPHFDGPMLIPGTWEPTSFSLLAGVWLTQHELSSSGNLLVWPGTHLRFGEYLAERGADSIADTDAMHEGPYPKIELGDPVPVTVAAGSVYFAHYLLAHEAGKFIDPTGDRRETVYYRLNAERHESNWRQAVTEPLSEFASA